jgi:hypothetical protein
MSFESRREEAPRAEDLARSSETLFSVIPAEAGIQCFQIETVFWTPVFTGVTIFLAYRSGYFS